MNHLIEEGSFDLLPDDVVLTIFQKLRDAKALCLSMCVCKRFHSIAPQVREISYDVAQKKPPRRLPKGAPATLKNLLAKALTKPFHLLSQMMAKAKARSQENDLDFYSSHLPTRVLKPFAGVRSVSLRLPCHGCSKQSKQQLKDSSSNFVSWRADFGREIRSCVILGAKSWAAKGIEDPRKDETAEQVMSEDELKLRIVWTISCLIAASARHYLVQETLRDRQSIEKIVVSDEIGQGIMSMGREGIFEMREQLVKEKTLTSSSGGGGGGDESVMAERRSKVPALKMKMWYLDRVEVPGKVLKGATLVVIRPAADVDECSEKMKYEEMVMGAFGEDLVLGEAAGKLMVAKRCYTLEMNSF